jgi:hypothetical protein
MFTLTRVLLAVDLDANVGFGAKEIDDARTKRALTPELQFGELSVPDLRPDDAFGHGHLAPELPRAILGTPISPRGVHGSSITEDEAR